MIDCYLHMQIYISLISFNWVILIIWMTYLCQSIQQLASAGVIWSRYKLCVFILVLIFCVKVWTTSSKNSGAFCRMQSKTTCMDKL
jgi:ABC-type transport system involved in cytochrome bd biosynthesis fused ATPase/permease subunit